VRILVTGVSGFSGSYVARTLCAAGHEVVGTYRRDTAFLAELRGGPGFSGAKIDLERAEKLPGPFDAVVHAAATSPASGIETNQIVRDNLIGTLALAEAARHWRCRAFVFFSSLSLYGEIGAGVLDENAPIRNPDAYGATKHLCELLLAERAVDVPCLALRLPGVLGPGAHRNWLSGVAEKLRKAEAVQAFHLDSPFNNAAHIDDIARLVNTTLARTFTGFDAVVLGARGTITVREAVERLAGGLGVTARIEARTPSKPSFVLSSERAISRWGYDPMEIGAMLDRYAAEMGRMRA
jgi:nucleoside-diphosphate-sugar epimerase